MLSQLLPSIIRTVVPLLVALFTSWLVKLGIDPGPYQELLSQLAGGLIALAYYVAVRVFETHVAPRLGWLLGYAKQPSYDPPAAPSEESPTGAVATEGTPGIPAGDPVDVIPADSSIGAGLGNAVQGVADGIYGSDPKVDAALHDPLDAPNEDYVDEPPHDGRGE